MITLSARAAIDGIFRSREREWAQLSSSFSACDFGAGLCTWRVTLGQQATVSRLGNIADSGHPCVPDRIFLGGLNGYDSDRRRFGILEVKL